MFFLFNPSAVITARGQLLAFIPAAAVFNPHFLMLGATSEVQGYSQTFPLLCNRAEQTRAMTKNIVKVPTASIPPGKRMDGAAQKDGRVRQALPSLKTALENSRFKLCLLTQLMNVLRGLLGKMDFEIYTFAMWLLCL